MSDVDVQVNLLKERVNAAEKKKLLHEHKLAVATSDFERVQEILREEFGVSSPEDAKKLMAKMESDLEELISQIDTQLQKFEVQP